MIYSHYRLRPRYSLVNLLQGVNGREFLQGNATPVGRFRYSMVFPNALLFIFFRRFQLDPALLLSDAWQVSPVLLNQV